MSHNMHIDQQIEIILWLQLKWQNLFIANNIHAENYAEEIVDCSHPDIIRKWRHGGRSKLTTTLWNSLEIIGTKDPSSFVIPTPKPKRRLKVGKRRKRILKSKMFVRCLHLKFKAPPLPPGASPLPPSRATLSSHSFSITSNAAITSRIPSRKRKENSERPVDKRQRIS